MDQKVFRESDRQVPQVRRTESSRFSPSVSLGGDSIDLERTAQQKEFLKRERKNAVKNLKSLRPSSKKLAKPGQPKHSTLDKQINLTNLWLEETFPHLFAADDYLPLDEHVLRDIKNDYKENQARKGYPPNLVIKAALVRYKENPGYLACLKAGAPRYALDGSITSTVTREEEERARKVPGFY